MRAVILALTLALSAPACAQDVQDVRFAPGNYGTMITGAVTGGAYVDYRLGASAGQEMALELNVTASDGNGTVYFNVLPPHSDGLAIHNGSIDGTTITLPLPETGTYTIRVYQMGNDRDSGRRSDFTLDVSIQ